jgi:hypothetical protein
MAVSAKKAAAHERNEETETSLSMAGSKSENGVISWRGVMWRNNQLMA